MKYIIILFLLFIPESKALTQEDKLTIYTDATQRFVKKTVINFTDLKVLYCTVYGDISVTDATTCTLGGASAYVVPTGKQFKVFAVQITANGDLTSAGTLAYGPSIALNVPFAGIGGTTFFIGQTGGAGTDYPTYKYPTGENDSSFMKTFLVNFNVPQDQYLHALAEVTAGPTAINYTIYGYEEFL